MLPAESIPVTQPKVDQIVVQTEKKEKNLEDFESTEAYVRDYFNDIPFMAEVARCESQFRHTDKNGNLLRGVVDSRDLGVMQINEWYHGDTSVKLGYDIHSIEGNMEYARYLYEKEGARPWMASAKCWSNFTERELARK